MPDLVWTDEQVRNINEFQACGFYHPFTCECPSPQRDNLRATRTGLDCERCGWHQTWVHPFMADGSAVAKLQAVRERLS